MLEEVKRVIEGRLQSLASKGETSTEVVYSKTRGTSLAWLPGGKRASREAEGSEEPEGNSGKLQGLLRQAMKQNKDHKPKGEGGGKVQTPAVSSLVVARPPLDWQTILHPYPPDPN